MKYKNSKAITKGKYCSACKTNFETSISFLTHIPKCKELKKLLKKNDKKKKEKALKDGLEGYKVFLKAGFSNMKIEVYENMIKKEKAAEARKKLTVTK